MRSVTFQSTTKFLPGSRWFLGSLLFVTNKFGHLNLQEPKSSEVAGLGTIHLPLASVRVGLISEEQLRHGSIELGEVASDPLGDKADHNQAGSPARMDPIYQLPLDSDSEGDRELIMAEQGEHPVEKMTEVIAREAEEELAREAQLSRDANRGKRHNDMHDDSRSSNDEPRDDNPSRRYYPKYNSRCPTGRDWLWDWSSSIHEEIGRIEY
jgi:hypothetical protein